MRDWARLAMAGCLAYGAYWLWASPVWRWNGQLHIVGNRLVSHAQILDRLHLQQGTPLFKLDPQKIAAQVTGIPAISQVAVHRWLFPARLELQVLERQALVAIVTPHDDLWFDQEGVVFEAPKASMQARFPIQVWTGLKPGDRLPADMQDPLFSLLSTWPHGQGGRIDLRNLNDVYAAIGGWNVRLGKLEDIPLKLGMLAHVQPLAQSYKDRLEYIDLRYPMSPALKLKAGGVIRPKGPAPAASAAPASASPTGSPSPLASASPGNGKLD
ncbi:MAG TPA: FtsQ-type POTRA domain-containing protein [Oscillatoriaceae cyanobacterium]